MYFKHIEALDETDNRILEILSNDARASYSYIGGKIGISRVAVKKRVDLLEKKGYIGGYKTLINRIADSNSIRFFMDLDVEPEKYGKVLGFLAMFKYCRQIYSCTGINRIHVTGYAPDNETLESFVAALYAKMDGIMKIDFRVVTATHKDSDGGIEYVRYSENEHMEKADTEKQRE